MPASIQTLPNELLQQIVFNLPPRCLPAFQRVCHRFNGLVNPLAWRLLCRHHYRYWRSEHAIEQRFLGEVELTDWRTLFVERQLTDRRTNAALNSILATQIGRLDKFRQILDDGYDAKDCLLEHCKVGDQAEDVLARRYYSNAVLGCIHRKLAIEEWLKLPHAGNVSLERAIGAFDAFVLQDREGDFNQISARLDVITASVAASYPQLVGRPTRYKALIINKCLREMQITGVRGELQEDDVRCHFLGLSLHSDEHHSSSLISAVIFCCVARRLGINASPGAFPLQVLAIVKPEAELDLDGNTVQSNAQTLMYLSPSSSDDEIPVQDLVEQLEGLRAPAQLRKTLLGEASIEELVLRAARNILHAVYRALRSEPVRRMLAFNRSSSSAPPFPDLESCSYGALWALLLNGPPGRSMAANAAARRRNYLPHLVEQFETNFHYDIRLIEQHLAPLFQDTEEHIQLRESTRVMRSVDSMPKPLKRRGNLSSKQVRYRVGQVFVHRRYNYQAVITGWDVECAAHEHWMARMRVDELSRGRQQSFYHVLVDDKSVRYVAEENIEPIYPECPFTLMPLAGQHFKRWDCENRRFVSNIADEYPDD